MDEKLSLISDLINLANADNHLDEQEVAFIHQIGNMTGLNDTDMLSVFEKPLPFNPPKLEFERIIQFHRMVLLMNIDQEINENELNYINKMGFRLGLNPGATNEVLERMYDYENHVIPPEELIRIFQRYHN